MDNPFGLREMQFHAEVLETMDPADMEPRLEWIPIAPKDERAWYAPAELKGEHADNFFAETAKRHLVPLYYLYQAPDKPILDILDDIARNRMNEIRRNWTKEKKNLLPSFREQRNFEEKWERETPDSSDEAWQKFADKMISSWKTELWDYLKNILTQELTFIELKKNEIDRAIIIFERLNNSGTSLSKYDLLVARAANCEKYKESLSDRVMKLIRDNTGSASACGAFSAERMGIIDSKTSRMKSKFQDQYLNLLSLLYHHSTIEPVTRDNIHKISNEIHDDFRAKAILSMESKRVHELSECAICSLLRALTFLNRRCGLLRLSDLDNKLMILPIAYLFQNQDLWKDKKALDRMEYWYWVSLFSGRYNKDQNRRCAEDIAWLFQFVQKTNNYNPFQIDAKRVLKMDGYSDFETLRHPGNVKKAVCNAIYSYVLSKEPCDLSSERSILRARDVVKDWDENGNETDCHLKLELHHIIPLAKDGNKKMKVLTKELRAQKEHPLNSPLNQTYISSKANSDIGAQSPIEYLKTSYGDSKKEHFIPDAPTDCADSKAQETFLKERYQKIYDDLQEHLKELYPFHEDD